MRRIVQCTLCLYYTPMKKNVVRHVSKHHTQLTPSTPNDTDSNNPSPFKSDENPEHDSVGADYDNDGAFETSFREDNGDLIEATPGNQIESNLAEQVHKYVLDNAGIMSNHPFLLHLFQDNDEEQDNKLLLSHEEQIIEEQIANEMHMYINPRTAYQSFIRP